MLATFHMLTVPLNHHSLREQAPAIYSEAVETYAALDQALQDGFYPHTVMPFQFGSWPWVMIFMLPKEDMLAATTENSSTKTEVSILPGLGVVPFGGRMGAGADITGLLGLEAESAGLQRPPALPVEVNLNHVEQLPPVQAHPEGSTDEVPARGQGTAGGDRPGAAGCANDHQGKPGCPGDTDRGAAGI
jgi:hypothetical protein